MKDKILKWLYDNYVGVRNSSVKLPTFSLKWPFVRIKKFYGSRVKAARIMFPFFLAWGSYKMFQSVSTGEVYWSWWVDLPFMILLAIQYVASFTNIVKNLYEKNNTNQ